jgi:hypothetical protein
MENQIQRMVATKVVIRIILLFLWSLLFFCSKSGGFFYFFILFIFTYFVHLTFEGAFARKMLQRKCFVVETKNYDTATTTLTLFIMEDRVIEGIRYPVRSCESKDVVWLFVCFLFVGFFFRPNFFRNRLAKQLTNDPEVTFNKRMTFEEEMKHNDKDILISTIVITLEDKDGMAVELEMSFLVLRL